MTEMTEQEREVAQLIVDALNLDDLNAEDIDPQEPLFRDGLGLDSIDALELALAISKRYGFQLKSDDEHNRQVFASLRSLSQHIEQNRVD
ncbi:phosphopantetheine-binding protein [Acidihalobacter ferrooxydans]|uniref:Acyl carrier protein n=1 Tax=Acidihalobacter ferrooxydans TaxID=1765967 RepID=A0A1P8UDY9_9GAMM|nr:phosphopantetheine-binding protein [Acidihalobacter ferrooxydans]APZ42043.1 acyl carrier protein [Acidihalobacter ferrooxydans]